MKTFTFKFVPQGEGIMKRLLRASKTNKADVHPNELHCSSYGDLLEIATEPRLEILRTIIGKKPKSLYELAKLVGRDQSYVLKEVKFLEALRIVSLKKHVVGGRECLRPISLYDNIVIDCGLSANEKRAS